MTQKLTHFEVEDEVSRLCLEWNPGCGPSAPCPAHRLLAHIEAQDQEITDLRTEMAAMRTELDAHRKAYWAYEPRANPTNPTKETTCQE